LFVVGIQGPVDFVVYPNKLVPWGLLPIAAGLAIHACTAKCGWNDVVKLGAALLVISLIHGLYGLFFIVLFGPALLAVAAYKLLRSTPDRWPQLGCLLVLAVALPIPLVTKVASNRTLPSAEGKRRVQTRTVHDLKFVEAGEHWRMKDPHSGFGKDNGLRYCLLLAGITAALFTRRRRQALLLSLAALVAGVILFVPPLCTAALTVLGASWMLLRLEFILHIAFVVLVIGAFAYLIESRTRYWWVRATISLLALSAAVPYAAHTSPYTWRAYAESAARPARERRNGLRLLRAHAAFLAEHVPRGETILAETKVGMQAAMLYDCFILAPHHGSIGVPGVPERQQLLAALLAGDMGWEQRRRLLKEQGIRFFLPNPAPPWLQGHTNQSWTSAITDAVLVELVLD
jgi:hypothetical protein